MKLHKIKINYKSIKNTELPFINGLTAIMSPEKSIKDALTEVFIFLMINKGKRYKDILKDNFKKDTIDIELFDENDNLINEIPDEFEFYRIDYAKNMNINLQKQFANYLKEQSKNKQIFIITESKEIYGIAHQMICGTKNKFVGINLKAD